ncbi:unnamed protein product [Bursaphelenchus xylophilus]|uniref:(pine wood nematode) hypothetical protein n=1 Tax=Bursaphelenchus xylophilus TaxID=6326 RepID=A0A1I7RIC6_BURXY|nr:unnamed protein product [Bursaphelenchus xylophilus]CAG9114986.1 unnamed protein product [Bursaphelenchus xylophilus]
MRSKSVDRGARIKVGGAEWWWNHGPNRSTAEDAPAEPEDPLQAQLDRLYRRILMSAKSSRRSSRRGSLLENPFAPQQPKTSPHFVHVQENVLGSALPSSPVSNGLSSPTSVHSVTTATYNGNAAKPQRRQSFLGSLFSGSKERLNQPSLYSNGYSPALNNNNLNNNNGTTPSSTSSGYWSSSRQSSPRTEYPYSGALGRQRASSASVQYVQSVVEHRPSTAKEAALETFSVIAQKRICVVRKFGSHVDNHVTSLLDRLGRDANTEATYLTVDQQTGAEILDAVQRPGLPLVFINGDCVGGINEMRTLHRTGYLAEALTPHDYDLIVLGGGAGGLAAAKEAASLGKRVACLNYIPGQETGESRPTASLINIDRIPKKIVQQAALIGNTMKNAEKYGWKIKDKEEQANFNWKTLRGLLQEHVNEINKENQQSLTDSKVTYLNEHGIFNGTHQVLLQDNRTLSADRFMLAVGLKSKLPQLKNAVDCCIGADELFAQTQNPGKTLCIGDSYVSLEIAGFLNALGNDVTVLLRSTVIRGFDEEVAEKIQRHMESCGVKFMTGITTKLERKQPRTDESPGIVTVSGEQSLPDGATEEFEIDFNTVLSAAQREPRTTNLNFQKPNIKLSTSGKVLGRHEQSQTAPHVYTVGDVLEGAMEFSPVSTHSAKLLMRRLYLGSMERTDYERVLISVLTPLEFCSCGLSEREAAQHFGSENITVYTSPITTMDATVPGDWQKYAFCKAVFFKTENERLVGFQVLAPNASEISTGFAMCLKLNAKRKDFDQLLAVHPTASEAFTRLELRQIEAKMATF